MSKLTKQQRRNKRIAKKAASKSVSIDALALLRKSADALIDLDSEQDYDVTPRDGTPRWSRFQHTLQAVCLSDQTPRQARPNVGVSLDQDMVQALTHDVGLQMRQLGVTQRERVVSGLLDIGYRNHPTPRSGTTSTDCQSKLLFLFRFLERS